MNRPYRFGACHYCICTACSRYKCPWSNKLYRECFSCRELGNNTPRLDCDFFSHYLKTHRFRFRRAEKPLPAHFGTYVLTTRDNVFVGSWERLQPLYKRFGGTLRKLDIISNCLGDDIDD